MATAPVEKSKELRDGTTSGMVVESRGETVMACLLPFGPDEPVNAGNEPEVRSAATGTSVSVPLHRDDFPTSLAGRLAAFNHWILGPFLSKQDRVNAQLVRARDELYWPG